MLRGRFVCTLRYPMSNAIPMAINGKVESVIELEELEAFVLEKRPGLRGQPYNIEFT